VGRLSIAKMFVSQKVEHPLTIAMTSCQTQKLPYRCRLRLDAANLRIEQRHGAKDIRCKLRLDAASGHIVHGTSPCNGAHNVSLTLIPLFFLSFSTFYEKHVTKKS
jgi:hypothetical protein